MNTYTANGANRLDVFVRCHKYDHIYHCYSPQGKSYYFADETEGLNGPYDSVEQAYRNLLRYLDYLENRA